MTEQMLNTQTSENKIDLKIRAIYIGDVRFDNCPVFELNTETNKFVMLSDNEFQYSDLDVYADKDFLVFEVYKERRDIDKFEDIETVKMI